MSLRVRLYYFMKRGVFNFSHLISFVCQNGYAAVKIFAKKLFADQAASEPSLPGPFELPAVEIKTYTGKTGGLKKDLYILAGKIMHMPSAPDEIIRAGARKFTRDQKPGQVPEISDVWSGKYQMAAWLEYPVDLLKGSQRGRQMLYHFKADYGVKIKIMQRLRTSINSAKSFP